MKTHLNTLFVTIDGSYICKDGAAVEIRHEGESKLRVPLHNLSGIVAFGWEITVSAALMHACAEANVALTFHNPYGKFLASTQGPISGNVLLRRAQYRTADNEEQSVAIARHIITAKIANTRTILQRYIREHSENNPNVLKLVKISDYLANRIGVLQQATNLDTIRGIEGDAAAEYFSVFNHLITLSSQGTLRLNGRTRRPPLDPVNALLSFLYALLAHDCRSAIESVGLDPQCGFLHRDRPGRPSLALDMMEEFRPVLADRAALTLINRQQEFRSNMSGMWIRKIGK